MLIIQVKHGTWLRQLSDLWLIHALHKFDAVAGKHMVRMAKGIKSVSFLNLSAGCVWLNITLVWKHWWVKILSVQHTASIGWKTAQPKKNFGKILNRLLIVVFCSVGCLWRTGVMCECVVRKIGGYAVWGCVIVRMFVSHSAVDGCSQCHCHWGG